MTSQMRVYDQFAGLLATVDGKLIGAALVDDSYIPAGTDTDIDSITGEVSGAGYSRGQFTAEWNDADDTARVAADAWPTFDISATATPVTGVVFFWDDTGPNAGKVISYIPYEEQTPVVDWVLQPLNGFARATQGGPIEGRLTAVEGRTVAGIPFVAGDVDADALAAALGTGGGGGGSGWTGQVGSDPQTPGNGATATLSATEFTEIVVADGDEGTIQYPADSPVIVAYHYPSSGALRDYDLSFYGAGHDPSGVTSTPGAAALSIGNAKANQLFLPVYTVAGGSGPDLSDATPADLGTADPGTSPDASRGDHVHEMPTAADVGAIDAAEKGANDGVAELDSGGKVPSSQLPSYVDDVVEAANFAALPGTGETGKIYVTLDDNKTFRWSGSAYVEISSSLALGETSSTAYRGDRGKTAYDHSQDTTTNPHGVTKAQVGLGNVTNDAQLKAADLDTDTAMTADSASKVPSQHAAKAYVDTATGLLVPKSLFDANTILYATTDNTPVALPVAASRIVGRKATGDIAALTGAEALAITGSVADPGGSNDDLLQRKSGAYTNRTPAQVGADLPVWPRKVSIANTDYPSSVTGTWTFNQSSAMISGGYFATAATNDQAITWLQLSMSAGTWAIDVWTRDSTNTGIITVKLGGSSVGTVDTYASVLATNVRHSLTGITVSTNGYLDLELSNPTKNASSSAFALGIVALVLRRTGA